MVRVALAALLLAGCAAGVKPPAAPGFFRVAPEEGRYWFVSPEGERFYSMGMNVIIPNGWNPQGDKRIYRGNAIHGGERYWAPFTAKRLRSLGFNTVGAWSHWMMERQKIPFCVSLSLAKGRTHRLIDVWDETYASEIVKEAGKQIGRGRSPENPRLMGYFLDNELPWYGSAGWPVGGDSRSLLDMYLKLPSGSPGRERAERAKREHGENLAAEEFAGEVAERFMELAAAAVRRIDPNHLILGVRIAGWAPEPVIRAIGKHTDVFSVNWYVKSGRPDPRHLDKIYLLARKPLMITEFSYRAAENRHGLKNSRGADVTVPTQAERAARYRQYVKSLAVLPQVIGFHWFQYFDQPTLGRFDGEDCNYGLVDHDDKPYEELAEAMKEINALAKVLHAESELALPTKAGEERPRLRLPLAGVDFRKPEGGKNSAGYTYVGPGQEKVEVKTWGDNSSKCAPVIGKNEGVVALEITSGPGWGCGVDLTLVGESPVDLAGAVRLKLKIKVTAGLKFAVQLTESGAGPRETKSFNGARGADGEQYVTETLEGTGQMEELVFELRDFELSFGYGNPSGNARLDSQALKYLALHVGGGQGRGAIEIAEIRFE